MPEVAARAHLEALKPTIAQALKDANLTMSQIDAIAVANGPGLAGALMVGIGAAKALAIAHNLPIYAVNHLVGPRGCGRSGKWNSFTTNDCTPGFGRAHILAVGA